MSSEFRYDRAQVGFFHAAAAYSFSELENHICNIYDYIFSRKAHMKVRQAPIYLVLP